MKKSLQARNNDLANTSRQLEILSNGIFANGDLPTFAKKNTRNQSVSITPK
jgi:hypothetical protein